jgi:hypothetical protein
MKNFKNNMKWIKLFEEYTQTDKVEAANVVYLMFKYNKLFTNLNLKKITNKKGETFYWEKTLNPTSHKAYFAIIFRLQPLRIFMGSRGSVRFSSNFIDTVLNVTRRLLIEEIGKVFGNANARKISDKALNQILNKKIDLHQKYHNAMINISKKRQIEIDVPEKLKFAEMIPVLSESVAWNEKF